MTQNELIVDYIENHGSISTFIAFQMGITRLAARVSELKERGYNIKSQKITYKMNGKTKSYVNYSMCD